MTTSRATADQTSNRRGLTDSATQPTLGDILRLIQARELPPPGAAATLSLAIVDIAEGAATFELLPAAAHLNADGTVNGGVIAVLADFALSCAVNDIPATASVATSDLNIHYQRPITVATGSVRATAHVLHRTRRTATVAAQVTDADGGLHAYATATIIIRPAATA
jgi:uncharacterized protein (TIGR00369 family)